MFFNLFIGILVIILGFGLLISGVWTKILPDSCQSGLFIGTQKIGCYIVNLVVIFGMALLIFVGAAIIWSSVRTTHCWGDILDGDPEALELLDERIKRLESLQEEKK